jgi:hypothetical protein
MKIVIALVVVIAVLAGAYKIWEYWDQVSHNQDIAEQQAQADRNVNPDSLQGMPEDLHKSYDIVKDKGPAALGNWLKAYQSRLEDPRKAWIQLDYVVEIAATDPQEAKRVFADVKGRITKDSKVYPRMESLEKTYQ